jgi:hypothetical protein
MRDVLLRLALTSQGRTAAYDSSGGGTDDWVLVDDNGRARLPAGDAPHLRYAVMWDAAEDDEQRRAVLYAAKEELDQILKSKGDRTREETVADRNKRIVSYGRGISAREVAVWARCGITDVWNARREAGLETEFGAEAINGREMTPRERDAEIQRLTRLGMNATQVAHALRISASTVRRALGLKR